MKNIKILFISDKGYQFGGVEINALNLAIELRKQGYIVKILTSDINPTDTPLFSNYTFKGYDEKSPFRWFYRIFYFPSYIKLKLILKEFKPDIIHLHNIFYQVSPSVLLAVGNIPTILRLCSYELICPMGGIIKFDGSRCISPGKHDLRCTGSVKGYLYELIKQFIHKYLLKKISLYLAPSESIKRDFFNQSIISSPIVVIHNGIPLLRYFPIINYNKLLYVGRLSSEKGVDVLLRAIKIIKKKVSNIKVDIVGDGPDKNALINLCRNLDLDENVRFVGKIYNNKIIDYYKKCTLLIIPSIWFEPFGLVGIEAMSVGRPVIASRVGGIPEWLENGKSGFLVNPGNSKQIAEKVIELFSDRKHIEEMSKNAYRNAERFSMKDYVKGIKKIYQKLF
jgi:glycosyltransferase involved in cell wall biosynthesis